MSKDKVQKQIRELIDSYEPITSLMRVSRDIERYGEVGEEERAALAAVLDDCKSLAEGIEKLLEGGAA